MSTSYYSGVVLGVKLKDIGFEIENISESYDMFDKKGKRTGEIGYDKSVKLTFNGRKREMPNLYSDVVEELINIKHPLIFLDTSINMFDIDNVIIGINLVNRSYDDWNILKELKVENNINIVKNELKNQFGVDVEPKLYFYFSS